MMYCCEDAVMSDDGGSIAVTDKSFILAENG